MKTFSKTPAESKHIEKICAGCGGDRFKPAWKDFTIPFVKCKNCGLVFQNPQPVPDELVGRYDSEYFDYEIDNEDNFFNLMLLGLGDVGFFEIEKKLLGKLQQEGKRPVFLDVGCATGRLIFEMKGRGWDVAGVEVCEPAARYGIENRGVDIRISPLEAASFDTASIDVVHCSHLIEHLAEPEVFVEEVARILKPGGIFIIVTPDISGFQARLFGAQWRSAIADHMYLFSKKTLSDLMLKSGFKIQNTASWGGLAAGTAPRWLKRMADSLAKTAGIGDVICIMGTISS